MVLAFTEHGTTVLHESDEAAVAFWGGIDIRAGAVSFYRDDGTYLKPIIAAPSSPGRFARLLRRRHSPTYHLAPDPDSHQDPLWLALEEHPDLKPSQGFTNMGQLKRHLVSKGAVVANPLSGL